MKTTFRLLALAIGLSASTVHAHGYWVVPSSTVLSAPQFVTFDAAVSNDPFQFNHRPLAIDSLVIIAPDGSHVAPINSVKGELRTVFDANLEQRGTYRLEMVRSGFRANWKDGDNKPKRFMGTAEEFKKEVPADAKELNVSESISRLENYVTVGKPSILKPTGQGLELVTGIHPNDLVAGETVEFTFLVDGKPTEGVEVVMVRGQTRYRNSLEEKKFNTDKNGKISVSMDEPGLYWLDADFKDNKVSNPLAKERGLAYVVTLEVLPQ